MANAANTQEDLHAVIKLCKESLRFLYPTTVEPSDLCMVTWEHTDGIYKAALVSTTDSIELYSGGHGRGASTAHYTIFSLGSGGESGNTVEAAIRHLYWRLQKDIAKVMPSMVAHIGEPIDVAELVDFPPLNVLRHPIRGLALVGHKLVQRS